jgi:hypothetical protein
VLQSASSRANGTKFGEPRKVDDPVHIATARMKADGHTGKDIAKYLGGEPGDLVPLLGRRERRVATR